MLEILGYVGLVVGPIGIVVGVIVALSNRQIRQERIEHLDGLVDDLRGEMNDNERRCAEKVSELEHRCSRLEGQVDTLTGDLGEKIGKKIAESVFDRLFEGDAK